MSATCLLNALAAHPTQLALSDGSQSLTAADVVAGVHTMAHTLTGCRVLAVLADNSVDWVLADLAALHLGVVHLPIPTFFSPVQMTNALAQTGTDAVLTDQPERIIALALGFERRQTLGTLTLLWRHTVPVCLPPGCAKISFTSGSTGTPKGVCLSATGLMSTAKAIKTTLADLNIAKHLAVLPLALLLENCAGMYAALLNGAYVHLPSLPVLGWRGMAGFDPAALANTVQHTTPNSLILVPELLKAWTLYLSATRQQAPDSLRFVAVGGAHVDPALLSQARRVGIPCFEGYGLTECGSVVSLNRPGDEGDGVGRVLPHVKLRLNAGEVHLHTPAFLGYTGDTPGTPALAQDFATGDLGHLDDQGHLHLMGRSKNLLITTYGRNISPEWVESVLLAQPAILQAVVMGDAKPWLVAIVVPLPGSTPAHIQAAVAQANTCLPDYAQVRRWTPSAPFTLVNGLATGNGRPMRSAITHRFTAEVNTLYKNEEAT